MVWGVFKSVTPVFDSHADHPTGQRIYPVPEEEGCRGDTGRISAAQVRGLDSSQPPETQVPPP